MTDLIQTVESLLEEMISFQKQKVLKVAREIDPTLTPEDIRNPQDFPKIYQDFLFNYEDGILTGYLAVQKALRMRFNELKF